MLWCAAVIASNIRGLAWVHTALIISEILTMVDCDHDLDSLKYCDDTMPRQLSWWIGGFLSGNFSIRFWRQYVSLFVSIAATIVPIVDFRQKKLPLNWNIVLQWNINYWSQWSWVVQNVHKSRQGAEIRSRPPQYNGEKIASCYPWKCSRIFSGI